jgi:predicted AlkP superfamily pyrophosphatase or phosphodiesterase
VEEVLPAQGGRSFADIPATVVRLLTGTGGDGLDGGVLAGLDHRWARVVLVVVDGFGWSEAERHSEHPFLRRIAAEGVMAQLTSQFPSTTAAHMTTLHTGVPVGESGVYEWFQYEPALDRLIAPLLFSYAGDDQRETLRGSGLDPAALYPRETIYERLARAGVRSSAVQHTAIADTTFSRAMLRGATVRSFAAGDGWVGEAGAASARNGPAYVVVYVDDVDATGHEHGPASDAHVAAATGVLDGLARLARLLPGDGETLLLATADHGQMGVHPATTVFVNERLPELARHLRRGADGRPLAPAGSARDLFLHVLRDRADDVMALLEDLLADTVSVRRTADLLAAGVFGEAGPRLRERIGNVVVLPGPGETVWWREAGRFDMRFRGHHGGLSPDEMLIPLAALPLG